MMRLSSPSEGFSAPVALRVARFGQGWPFPFSSCERILWQSARSGLKVTCCSFLHSTRPLSLSLSLSLSHSSLPLSLLPLTALPSPLLIIHVISFFILILSSILVLVGSLPPPLFS